MIALRVLALYLCFTCANGALRNVTIDDLDSSISYSGNWIRTDDGTGGFHGLAESDPNAFAIFRFTGVAVYYMSPKWPYHVGTDVSLDGGRAISLDLQDYGHTSSINGVATVASAVIIGWPGLSNTAHTLRISVGTNEPYAVVDGFIYTVNDPDPSSTPIVISQPSSAQSSPTQTILHPTSASSNIQTNPSTSSLSSTSRSTTSSGLRIALAIVGTIAGLIIFALLFWYYRRYRRQREYDSSIARSPPPTTYADVYTPSSPQAVFSGTSYYGPNTTYGNNQWAQQVPHNQTYQMDGTAANYPPAFLAGGSIVPQDYPDQNPAVQYPPYSQQEKPRESSPAPQPSLSDGRSTGSDSRTGVGDFHRNSTMTFSSGGYTHPQPTQYRPFQ